MLAALQLLAYRLYEGRASRNATEDAWKFGSYHLTLLRAATESRVRHASRVHVSDGLNDCSVSLIGLGTARSCMLVSATPC